ncbi:sorbosone dehydrogenase family protein [Fulvivirgaceae bacterium PWU4]|uniref:Sorbosone dehydrogenase family protein n=1 Tax=Chryseosolibacter histidini TaxID=2782349 RepID=A0AAP2DK30_9BACT|nr:sorbosone dehydrogenase family protein [Chryseosolibacter histidini]MBT1697818.1 sorbosone dehydrogenase family protein [Chryseosolibacter histidini]
MHHLKHFTYLLALLLLACGNDGSNNKESQDSDTIKTEDGSVAALTDYAKSLPLDKIKLPAGFKIDVYAEVNNARSLAISPSGIIYVGNRDGDKVYAIKDTDGDFKADKKWTIASGLNMPNGVAFKDGDLYVAEMTRIIKFPGIESKLNDPGQPVVVNDQYPKQDGHGWKYIAFGPDGKLYVPVGAPCNICEPKEEIYASITRINADGSGREIFARGIRNTVGFTWHPETHELWFTDNGRDMMGDEIPNCELNTAPKAGMHFGYPYCHEGAIKDPQFGSKRPCSDFTPPVQKMGPHVAPLGLKFYTGSMFPASYKNQLIVARHGSWNRSKKSGHDLSLVKIVNNKSEGLEVFASGWLDDATQKVWGRPVDVLILPDGSMLVSDDQANVIYRITYQG